MEGMDWKGLEGKTIYVRLKSGFNYSGIVLEVETSSNSPLIFIILRDKFGKIQRFVHSEILQLEEK